MEWVRGLPAATVYILDVQPVVPIKLTHDWNLITRTIVSIINWGIGPTFTLPTATDWRLGTGKFSLGPPSVGLFMGGPWVVGALDRDVN
jgi:hypothetical protein